MVKLNKSWLVLSFLAALAFAPEASACFGKHSCGGGGGFRLAININVNSGGGGGCGNSGCSGGGGCQKRRHCRQNRCSYCARSRQFYGGSSQGGQMQSGYRYASYSSYSSYSSQQGSSGYMPMQGGYGSPMPYRP